MVEWSIAPVLKTGMPQGIVGSNPTPSATRLPRYIHHTISELTPEKLGDGTRRLPGSKRRCGVGVACVRTFRSDN